MLLQGLLASQGDDKYKCMKYFGRAMDILDGGVKKWPNESDRGVIFSDTFVRGVRRVHLTAYMNACGQALQWGDKKQFPLSTLKTLAENALKEVETAPPPMSQESVCFRLAFWDYCKANALATLGWYYRKMARFSKAKSDDEVERWLFESAQCYLKASGLLPEDEELRYCEC